MSPLAASVPAVVSVTAVSSPVAVSVVVVVPPELEVELPQPAKAKEAASNAASVMRIIIFKSSSSGPSKRASGML